MKTGFEIVGTLKFENKRSDGTIISLSYKNMVVSVGLIGLAGVIAGTAFPYVFTHLALGDSQSAPALGNTELGNELRRDAAVITQLATPNDNQVQFQVTHAQGAVVGTFYEAGIFDAATAGNMFNRLVFDEFVVGSGDTLTVTWLIEIRNA